MTLNHKSIEEAYNLINKKIIKTPLVSNDYINNLLNSKLRLIKKNILPPRYRGGGNTFTNNNNLYIPIQPSEVNFYGQRLCIYRIKKIENNEIAFEYCYDVKIPSIYKGIHHLSNNDNIFICDICS